MSTIDSKFRFHPKNMSEHVFNDLNVRSKVLDYQSSVKSQIMTSVNKNNRIMILPIVAISPTIAFAIISSFNSAQTDALINLGISFLSALQDNLLGILFSIAHYYFLRKINIITRLFTPQTFLIRAVVLTIGMLSLPIILDIPTILLLIIIASSHLGLSLLHPDNSTKLTKRQYTIIKNGLWLISAFSIQIGIEAPIGDTPLGENPIGDDC